MLVNKMDERQTQADSKSSMASRSSPNSKLHTTHNAHHGQDNLHLQNAVPSIAKHNYTLLCPQFCGQDVTQRNDGSNDVHGLGGGRGHQCQ